MTRPEDYNGRVRHLPLVALVGWAAAIFIASSIPNPPDAGGDEWKYEAAHVFEYAVFGALALLTLRTYLRAWPTVGLMATAFVVSVLYGMSDEFHQSFVPNRDANWLDVVFDGAGAAIGIGVVAGVIRRRALRDARRSGRAAAPPHRAPG